MSILTTLALMTSAVVAKLRVPDSDIKITRLQTRVDELDRQLMNLERDFTTARIEADRWRALVERYQGRAERPAGPDFRAVELAREQTRQLQAMAQAQQYNQGLAAVNFSNPAQGLQFGGFCNCVPARHDAFRGIMSS
jgi:hypothetical protein